MDSYADNLAKVNEVRDVVASDDILNAQGQILVKKGARIDQTMAERITRFKLLKPLEHTVVIENELTAQALAECFEAFLSGNSATRWFHEQFFRKDQVLAQCETVCRFAVIRQKLTVLSLVMPEIFEQAMFCAWMGSLICERDQSQAVDSDQIFFAGLCHDIGMIHIRTEVLNKTDNLSPEEWRQIQAHPIIAWNILKEIKGVPAVAARAVLEHHEALDGTSYPRGKMSSELAFEGLLLNLLDSLNAQYVKFCKPLALPLSALIPVVQMSRHSRFGPVAKKLIVLLREARAAEPPEYTQELIPEVARFIREQSVHIGRCLDIIAHANRSLGFRHNNANIAAIQNAIIHITMSAVQSGVCDEVYLQWLDTVAAQHSAEFYSELVESGLMMQEIIYQLDSLQKIMAGQLQQVPDKSLTQVLDQQASQLQQLNRPKASETLQTHWLFQWASA